ncbi:hypothetical protein PFAG_01651 [Plasmodium falciparum Santa Lucia]|uniref:Uncharacterized protein n=1 Tax=Plasmodium falciparum Santa Lucia TaxID=478859 RepID=W7G1K4_PLAFA|nr:hypothetical protein PFAG_01651 [Plasmodium falciparum Santa Lucia]
METISNYNSNARHKLLGEVCMAAKYEGNSIETYYTPYLLNNEGTSSQLCTVLARSFADIGDIIRGRDLYRRDKGEKKKRDDLEENLKTIFKNIYDNLVIEKPQAEARYQDKNGGNFFKLREDWWTANRATIWEALTCDARDNAEYFRQTCGDSGSPSMVRDKCRCKDENGKNTDQVPTYFDYVPQYLRWFEEWAEDFCRKKKKKVENLEKQCRKKDKNSDDRYCSRNGYDCEQTVNARGKVRMGKGCTDCFFACYPYVDWINNQRKQFLKQRNKYADEINGTSSSSRTRRAARGGSDHKGYEKIFYDKLKGHYSDVGEFLEKLSNEDVCKKVKDGGTIDFKNVNTGGTAGSGSGSGDSSTNDTSGTNDENKGTFYRSKYCQPCPICGMKKNNGEWEHKKSGRCKHGNLYKPANGAKLTEIRILKSGDGQTEIEEKLNKFCQTEDDESLYAAWKCYNDVEKVNNGEDDDDEEGVDKVKEAGGLCILQNKNKKEKEKETEPEPDEIQKTFHDFFFYWVAHMLKDSIHWRTKKIKGCLEKKNDNTCKKNKCNDKCKCYESWVKKKKTEWTNIKDHFNTQEGFDKAQNQGLGFTHDFVLQCNLQIEFLKGDSEEKSEEKSENSLDAQELKHLRQMLQETGVDASGSGDGGMCGIGVASDGKKKTIMDKLIEHEEGIAETCKKCEEPPQEQESVARSDEPPANPTDDNVEEEGEHSSDAENDEEDDLGEDDEDGDGAGGSDGAVEAEASGPQQEEVEEPTTPGVNPCDIVDKLFKKPESLQAACSLKYGPGGKEKFPNWKCIPSGESGDAKRQRRSADSSGNPTSDNKGGLCIPPRRRRLYVTPLTKWASQVPLGDTTSQSDKESSQSEKLRDAFIESAAIETFFLWHRYKKQKEKPQGVGVGGLTTLASGSGDGDSNDPDKQLKSGNIPNDFLRLMFYTLGDYRDILVRGGDVNSGSGSEKDSSSNEKNLVVLLSEN